MDIIKYYQMKPTILKFFTDKYNIIIASNYLLSLTKHDMWPRIATRNFLVYKQWVHIRIRYSK